MSLVGPGGGEGGGCWVDVHLDGALPSSSEPLGWRLCPIAHGCSCLHGRISKQELQPISVRARVFIELPLSITG